MKRFSILLFSICLFLPMVAMSLEGISYHLAFSGYRFGMTFDQANSEQPFQHSKFINSNGHVVGYVDLIVDEIPMDVRVCFKRDKAYKIISRFNPDDVPSLVKKYTIKLGPPMLITRDFLDRDGQKVHLVDYRWSLPDAGINLVSYTSNKNFATLGSVQKRHPTSRLFMTPDRTANGSSSLQELFTPPRKYRARLFC